MDRWLTWMGVGAYFIAAACVPRAPTAPPEAKHAPAPSAAVTAAATDTISPTPSPSVSSISIPTAAEDVTAAPRSAPAPSVHADLLREPLFVAAEQKRHDAERIVRPVYRGDRNEKDMADFLMRGEWAVWRKAKKAAIEDAARAYARILELRPAPPSGWVIAVHARVGALWASFAEEVRDVPVPDKLSGHPNVDHTVEWRNKFGNYGPEMVRATGAFHQCSKAARRAHIADEQARICDAWLARHARP